MKSSLFRPEWDFARVFVPLSAVTIVSWYLGKDKLVVSRPVAQLYFAALESFGLSLTVCLANSFLLVFFQRAIRGANTAQREWLRRVQHSKLAAILDYLPAVYLGLYTAGCGFAVAVMALHVLRHAK